MNDKWKETFDPIRAESSLKHHTKEYLAKKVYRKKGFLFFSIIVLLLQQSVWFLFFLQEAIIFIFSRLLLSVSISIPLWN